MTITPDNAIAARSAEIPMDAAGRRIDQVLAELFPEFSRSRLSSWIKAGQVRVDGRVPKPRDAVRGGESVIVDAVLEPATTSAPEAIALSVLYEDADLLVIDKPAGLVVHPGAGNPAGTLVNALLHRDPALALLPRAGIVHRLDKDTSGALIVARTLPAHTALVAQLAAREVHRQYEAIVTGVLIVGGSVDAPLDRHPVDLRGPYIFVSVSPWSRMANLPSPITGCASATASTAASSACWKPGAPTRSACTWHTCATR